jgi:hypothetical protein
MLVSYIYVLGQTVEMANHEDVHVLNFQASVIEEKIAEVLFSTKGLFKHITSHHFTNTDEPLSIVRQLREQFARYFLISQHFCKAGFINLRGERAEWNCNSVQNPAMDPVYKLHPESNLDNLNEIINKLSENEFLLTTRAHLYGQAEMNTPQGPKLFFATLLNDSNGEKAGALFFGVYDNFLYRLIMRSTIIVSLSPPVLESGVENWFQKTLVLLRMHSMEKQ